MIMVLNILYVAAVVLLLFGAAIFVHEFGHFWVARRRGLKVEEFAIGFGPVIWSKEKDGILYSIRAIPAGGFVKLPQMITSEAIEGTAAGEQPLAPVSPLSKILVAFAGPFMNVVFAVVIATVLWAVGLPKPVNDPVIGYVEKGSAEEKAGIQPGDRILAIGGSPVSTWQDIILGVLDQKTADITVTFQQGNQTVTKVLKSDSTGGRFKMLKLDDSEALPVQSVKAAGPFEAAGVRAGDTVVAVNGVPVFSHFHFLDQLFAKPDAEAQITVVRKEGNQTLTVKLPESAGIRVGAVPVPKIGTWSRFWMWTGLKEQQEPKPTPAMVAGLQAGDLVLRAGDERLTSTRHLISLVQQHPEQEVTLHITRDGKAMPIKITPRKNLETGAVQIGVMLEQEPGVTFAVPQMKYSVVKPGPTPWAQITDVWNKTVTTISALFRSKETGVGAKDLSGPVGILGMLSIFVNTDFRLALSFLVLLNINLAVLNLLPVPVLDGGHILLSIIERIRNKPVSMRVQEYATTAFAVVLLSFMVYVTFFDLQRVPLFSELFNRDTAVEQQVPGGSPKAPSK